MIISNGLIDISERWSGHLTFPMEQHSWTTKMARKMEYVNEKATIEHQQ